MAAVAGVQVVVAGSPWTACCCVAVVGVGGRREKSVAVGCMAAVAAVEHDSVADSP